MKKILTSAAFVLLLAGCSQNETFDQVDPSNTIQFSPYAGVTKAQEVANTNASGAKPIDEFGIVGYTSGGTAIANLGHVKYTGSVTPDNTWTSEAGVATWPTASGSYPVSFYAYYPQASNAASGITATAKTVSYTVGAAGTQTDLLAASVTDREYGDYLNVQLNFKHILSQIKFKVAVGTDLKVQIAKIEIVKVGNAATFDFAKVNTIGNATGQQSGTSAIWTQPATTTATYDFGMGTNVATYTYNASDANDNVYDVTTTTNSNLMLIPQATSGGGFTNSKYNRDGAYIRVTYMMYNPKTYNNIVGKLYVTGGQSTELGTPLFVKAAFRLDLANFDGSSAAGKGWLPGKKYTYTLTFGKDGGNGGYNDNQYFVDKDGNNTSEEVSDPSGTPLIAPGDPLLPGKNIVFKVDVAGWTEPTGIPVQ